MNDLTWVLPILLLASTVILAFFLMSKKVGKRIASVWEMARNALPEASFDHRRGDEASLETQTTVYLIKAIPFHPEHELIVTNQTYWCVNDKPSQWRRSSKPELIDGVADFLAWRPDTRKKVVRIGVVTPGCRNITFHVNECDVVVVEPTTDVYGYRLLRLSDLADFLRKAERK
jgi:hypothetical protein